ncbi:MAG: ATP-binding cassette domain-containing protein [Xanthomonadales bacterium]|nr:ATP-binding cassette domain-containing protein [Xanthomonadales bacterium]
MPGEAGKTRFADNWRTLKTLLPLLRAHRRLLVAWLGFLAVSSAATLSLPFAVRLMIDHGFSQAESGAIDRWFILLFGVAAVLALATGGRFYAVSLLGERVVADLRRRLYEHLLYLDLAFFDRNRSGELVSRLSADTEQIRSMVGSSLSIALRSILTFLGSATMLLVTSPRLAAIAALGIPLVVLPIIVFGRRVQSQSKQSQDRIADANAQAAEVLGAMPTVQSFAREAHESRRFDQAVEQALKTARKRIRMQSLLTASVILLVFGAVVFGLWMGAKAVVGGQISVGVLSQFVLYAVLGAGSVGALSEVWADVQRTTGGMARLRELFDERSAVAATANAVRLSHRARGDVVFDNITFHYPSRPNAAALDGFSLHVGAGDTVALVGPSGAGKSTVLQLLLRFFDPQAGSVRLDGTDLRELDPQSLREQIAVVAQHPVIFATSAMENIRYGRLDATDEEVRAAARVAEAHEFLTALPDGYQTQLGERGARLSGGQQQRIAIARAVLKDAPVLLLDEATSALDAASERAVQTALGRLMEGRTTLVVAHRLATVRHADRIVVMQEGRVVDQGDHESLFAQDGLYAELARLQFQAD